MDRTRAGKTSGPCGIQSQYALRRSIGNLKQNETSLWSSERSSQNEGRGVRGNHLYGHVHTLRLLMGITPQPSVGLCGDTHLDWRWQELSQ